MHGCRPVLYLSNKELSTLTIPEKELWRVVRLESVDGTGVNWLHEREWRAKGSFHLPSKLLAVLVNNTKSAQRLQELINDDPIRATSNYSALSPLSGTAILECLPSGTPNSATPDIAQVQNNPAPPPHKTSITQRKSGPNRSRSCMRVCRASSVHKPTPLFYKQSLLAYHANPNKA